MHSEDRFYSVIDKLKQRWYIPWVTERNGDGDDATVGQDRGRRNHAGDGCSGGDDGCEDSSPARKNPTLDSDLTGPRATALNETAPTRSSCTRTPRLTPERFKNRKWTNVWMNEIDFEGLKRSRGGRREERKMKRNGTNMWQTLESDDETEEEENWVQR